MNDLKTYLIILVLACLPPALSYLTKPSTEAVAKYEAARAARQKEIAQDCTQVKEAQQSLVAKGALKAASAIDTEAVCNPDAQASSVLTKGVLWYLGLCALVGAGGIAFFAAVFGGRGLG